MKIKIIGNGVWGKALYSVIQHNSQTVSMLMKHTKSDDQDVIILCVPTQSLRDALQYISFKRENNIVINTAKGIEQSTHLLPYQISNEVLGNDIEYYSLIGPSFAKEVIQKMPTLMNLGYHTKTNNSLSLKNILQTDYFRIQLTKGVEVLELSAAFKNIYAIGCGLADGLGYGTNTRIKLISLAIDELKQLARHLHYHIGQHATAGIIGDLVLTCSSTESRNFTFGKYLANNFVDQSLQLIKSTVEGYHSIASVDSFSNKAHIRLPLAYFISETIQRDNPENVKKFFEEFVKKST